MVEEKNNTAAKLRFDTSINLGHILTMLTLGGAIALAYTSYRVEITELSTRVTILENISKTQEATTIAVHSIRSDIAIMRDRLERMEHERQEREQEERSRRLQWERGQPQSGGSR